MRFASLLMLLALTGTAAGTTLYRWVDEEGVLHYSDRPAPGAEVVQLREPSSYEAPSYGSPSAGSEAGEESGDVYSGVEILQPTEDEVLWNIEGRLPVSVRVRPRLQGDDAIQIYYDGQAVGEPSQGGGGFELTEVWRGTHTLQAAVVDPDGQELARSPLRTFHVRQTSLQNPNNPQLPRRTPNRGGGR